MPLTLFRAERQGSSRYSARIWCVRIERLFQTVDPSARRRDDASGRVEGRRAAAERPELGARHLVAGVVARAHERSGFDVPEAEGQGLGLHLRELVGMVVALEREVLLRGPEVLADRQDVDVDGPQGLECLRQLTPGLAEPDHERALGVRGVADVTGHLLRPAEDVEGAFPAGPLADRLLEPA